MVLYKNTNKQTKQFKAFYPAAEGVAYFNEPLFSFICCAGARISESSARPSLGDPSAVWRNMNRGVLSNRLSSNGSQVLPKKPLKLVTKSGGKLHGAGREMVASRRRTSSALMLQQCCREKVQIWKRKMILFDTK